MTRYNVGDIVVSIHNFRKIKKHTVLVISKIKNNSTFEQFISFKNQKEIYYNSNYFISLVEHRKRKILKLKVKINERSI